MTSNSSQDNRVSNPSQEPYDLKVVKEYPPRGSWTLHRLASPTSFTCSRCDRVKKAKLVATRDKIGMLFTVMRVMVCFSQNINKVRNTQAHQAPKTS